MKLAEDEYPALCARCQGVFLLCNGEKPHTKQWRTLEASASNGCRLCTILYDHLKTKVNCEEINVTSEVLIHFNRIRFEWDQDGCEGTRGKLYFAFAPYNDPTGAEDHQVEESTASLANKRLALGWVERCATEHTACNKNRKAWYPTRVLDLKLFNASGQIRLIETRTEPLAGPYVALSYCWGKTQPLTLRKDTYQGLAEGFSSSLLPLTLYHAATVVASWFQIRYLWVDALCIMQDSIFDWTQETKTMRQVYQNCFFVIAATASTNTSEGCFRTRKPSVVPALMINHGLYSNTRIHFQGPLLVFRPGIWDRGVDCSPLAHRAWTVQERFLAPRVLHFGAEQLFWECHQGVACETFPIAGQRQQGLPSIGLCGSLSANMAACNDAEDPYYVRRSRLVKTFMAGSLTKSSDKLLAFAGVAEQMMAVCRGDKYLAGLWRNQFGRWLLWCIKSCSQADGTPSVRSRVYRAPSWSWLSVDGEVLTGIITIDGPILSEVIDVDVELVDKSFLAGDIKGGVAVLSGVLTPVSWMITEAHYTGNRDRRYRNMIDGEDRGVIYFDEAPDPEDQGSGLWFLPLDPPIFNSEDGEVRGLLLECVSSNDNVFQRLGVACVSTTRTEYPFFFRRRHLAGGDDYTPGCRRRIFPLLEELEQWDDIPRQRISII